MSVRDLRASASLPLFLLPVPNASLSIYARSLLGEEPPSRGHSLLSPVLVSGPTEPVSDSSPLESGPPEGE